MVQEKFMYFHLYGQMKTDALLGQSLRLSIPKGSKRKEWWLEMRKRLVYLVVAFCFLTSFVQANPWSFFEVDMWDIDLRDEKVITKIHDRIVIMAYVIQHAGARILVKGDSTVIAEGLELKLPNGALVQISIRRVFSADHVIPPYVNGLYKEISGVDLDKMQGLTEGFDKGGHVHIPLTEEPGDYLSITIAGFPTKIPGKGKTEVDGYFCLSYRDTGFYGFNVDGDIQENFQLYTYEGLPKMEKWPQLTGEFTGEDPTQEQGFRYNLGYDFLSPEDPWAESDSFNKIMGRIEMQISERLRNIISDQKLSEKIEAIARERQKKLLLKSLSPW